MLLMPTRRGCSAGLANFCSSEVNRPFKRPLKYLLRARGYAGATAGIRL